MAQKKLLFSLILICLLSTEVLSQEEFVLRARDQELPSSISKKVKEIALKEIKDKWIDLQKLLGMKPDADAKDNQDFVLDTGIIC